jgi:hypothetical protein
MTTIDRDDDVVYPSGQARLQGTAAVDHGPECLRTSGRQPLDAVAATPQAAERRA